MKTDFSDLHAYPGIDLRPKIAGARRLAAGLSPYALRLAGNESEYFRTNQIPYNTPVFFILYMPLSSLPYEEQRTIYYLLDWVFAAAALLLFERYLCSTAEQRYFCWIVYAAFIVCSFSFRLDAERGQYYVFLLLLASHAAMAIRNNWTGWLSCIPAALLILLRPTYGLLLVAAFLLRDTRKWGQKVAVAVALMFLIALPAGGVRRWVEFQQSVRAHQMAFVNSLPMYCGAQAAPASTPAEPQLLDGIDFSKSLQVHSITGTLTGVSMIRFGLLSRRLAFLCGYPSPQWIGRINSSLLGAALLAGLGLAWLARRRVMSRNLLAASMTLWPILVELFSPERNLYTAVLEVVPLLLLLMDWKSVRLRRTGFPGIRAWVVLLALGVIPPIVYQIVDRLAVREAMSGAILILLPLGLAVYCVWALLASPRRAQGVTAAL